MVKQMEEMEQPNEQDEPEFVETVEEPPEPETDEDLFAALMNEDANEDSQEHMSTESDEKPEDDFSIADIESDVPRDIDADNAVEVKVEPESEIDPEIPVMEEEISQEEEPQQEELQQAVTEPRPIRIHCFPKRLRLQNRKKRIRKIMQWQQLFRIKKAVHHRLKGPLQVVKLLLGMLHQIQQEVHLRMMISQIFWKLWMKTLIWLKSMTC